MKNFETFENWNCATSREKVRQILLKTKDKVGDNFVINLKELATNTIWTIQAVDRWNNVFVRKAGTKGARRSTRLGFFPDSIESRKRGVANNAIYR